MKLIKRLFGDMTLPATGRAEKIAAEQLEQARCASLEAQSHAEYYTMLAKMYRDRVQRLENREADKLVGPSLSVKVGT